MKFFIPILLLSPCFLYAQNNINTDTLTFDYSGVVQVDTSSAKILQSRAKLFIAENFKSAKSVIQLDDQEAGVIVAKGNFVPTIKAPLLGHIGYGYVSFSLKLQFKDGKYKYTITDFFHTGDGNVQEGGNLTNTKPACGTFLMSKDYWHQVKLYSNKHIIDFIAILESKMRSPELTAKKDDF